MKRLKNRKMRQILSFLLASALGIPTKAYSQPTVPPRLHTDDGRIFVHLVKRSSDVLLIDPAQAIEQLNLALEKDSSWEAYAVRAAAQERLGNYSEAIADYSRALEANLYDLNVIRTIYQARGRAYADVGKHELAIKDFTALVEAPMGQGRRQEADGRRNFLEKDSNPHFLTSSKSKTILLDSDPGLSLLPSALCLLPSEQSDVDNVMQIYGCVEEASLDEQTLVVNAYLGRGQSYEALLQYRQAMKDYEQAIRLSPNNDTAKRFQTRLHSKLQPLFEEEK